ncbi:MAG: zf-HC2 domain-containing protein [Acidobacteriota bacterium]
MNCRRVQKLIPLHVEGDLRSSIANQIASHLEWCGRCNWLADEYKESQSWLRTSQPPELDEACLEDLKRGVMKRVAQESIRPSLFASIAQQWSRRQILALSTAFLVVLGMVALYLYQARVKVNPDVISEGVKQPPNVGPYGINPSPAPGSTGQHLVSKGRPHFKPRHPNRANASETFARAVVPPMAGINNTAITPANQTRALSGNADGSREMLRIEIQTGDPSIRIIWFAPKGSDLQQPKPATD